MLYKMDEWQGATGEWYCNCVSNFAGGSGHWSLPARILNMTPAAYIEWVIINFHPIVWHNDDCSLVFFSWVKQSDMRRYKNKINAAARQINYQI
jgi:hypothetical protein